MEAAFSYETSEQPHLTTFWRNSRDNNLIQSKFIYIQIYLHCELSCLENLFFTTNLLGLGIKYEYYSTLEGYDDGVKFTDTFSFFFGLFPSSKIFKTLKRDVCRKHKEAAYMSCLQNSFSRPNTEISPIRYTFISK
jgi:hypothetical protein